MEFTWKQFIELIEKTFEISQNEIAIYLGVNRSTITRLHNGTTCSPSFGNNEMYKKIFNLSNPESLARKKNTSISRKEIECSVLDTIKQIMEREHWINSTKEINSNKYKDYIMGLIALARTNSTKNALEIAENFSQKNSPVTNGSAKISILLQYQKCLYCEYFHIAETEHKNISNPLGTCTVHERKMKSVSTACEYFQENIGKINRNTLIGDFSLDNLRL